MLPVEIFNSSSFTKSAAEEMNTPYIYRLKVILHYIAHIQFLKVKVRDKKSEETTNFPIPNNVIQTCATKYVPLKLHSEILSAREKNHDFNFLTFNNKEMTRWMQENYCGTKILDAFSSCRFGVMKSDIFRYCYIYKNGGISLDLTKGLSKELNKFFCDRKSSLVLTQERQEVSGQLRIQDWFLQNNLEPNLLVSWCFGAKAHHPAILSIIEHVENRYETMPKTKYGNVKEAIWYATGPIVFNEALIAFFSDNGLEGVMITEKDFGEGKWPKFKSSSSLNVFRKHYTENENAYIWSDLGQFK